MDCLAPIFSPPLSGEQSWEKEAPEADLDGDDDLAQKAINSSAVQLLFVSYPAKKMNISEGLGKEMNESEILLESCRFYIEGVALLPISIVGIIGKTFYRS